MSLQPLRCGRGGRVTVRMGKALAAYCCVMALGLASCWAADSTESAPGVWDATSERSWSLKLPDDGKVVFSGALDYAGGSAGSSFMPYPAPNAVAFVAAVVTHGLIVDSQKNSQRKKAQEYADKVLDPYQSILGTVSYQQLARLWAEDLQPGARRKLVGTTDSPGSDDWLIEATPVFLMAQDRRTLTLDALISIRAPSATENAYQNRIRVISPAVGNEDPAGAWAAEEGKKLKEVSAWLLSESLNIAMRTAIDGSSNNDQPFRTIRYLEGTAEKMERAQLVSEHCGRLVIKTLRGSLMSVPVKASTTTGSNGGEMACESAKDKTSYPSPANLESPEDKLPRVIEQAESGGIGKT